VFKQESTIHVIVSDAGVDECSIFSMLTDELLALRIYQKTVLTLENSVVTALFIFAYFFYAPPPIFDRAS